jgi:NAD dependent epimerase/dehydratase family enzyme
LAEALAERARKPKVLVCASGQGIYPSSGDQVLTEQSAIGSDFLAGLQRDGEAATATASAAGIRVVHLRIPTVLGGPNLAAMTSNLRIMGSGRQWWSWVALDEFPRSSNTSSYHTLLEPSTCQSRPVRAGSSVRPGCVLDRQRRSVPAFLLRLVMGEMAEALLLASRRIEPRRLLETGYEFRFPELEAALRHQLGAAA